MTYFCYLICLSNNFSSVAKVLEIVLINPIKIVTSAITLCYFYFYLIFLSFCFKFFFFFFLGGACERINQFHYILRSTKGGLPREARLFLIGLARLAQAMCAKESQ